MKIPLFMPLLRGCASIVQKEDGVLLNRMTPGFLKFYTQDEHDEIRAQCPTGIRIIFNTNSKQIGLPVRFGRVARPVYAFDVFIDGKPASFEQQDGLLSIETDGAEHTIEIRPPNLVECFFGAIELDHNAEIKAVAERKNKAIFIGDSIMQGMTVSRPGLMYTSGLADALDADSFNFSVGGAVMKGEKGLFALECDWNIVFLGYGVNDFNLKRPLAKYKNDTEITLSHLTKRPGAKIFTVGPIPMNGRSETREDGLKLSDFANCLKDVSAKFQNVHFLDGFEAFPRDASLYIDEIHPNDEGEEVLLKNLLKQINAKTSCC